MFIIYSPLIKYQGFSVFLQFLNMYCSLGAAVLTVGGKNKKPQVRSPSFMGTVNVSMNFSRSLSKQSERLLQFLCVINFNIYDSDYETRNAESFTLGQEGK